jgi:hypothetical protein
VPPDTGLFFPEISLQRSHTSETASVLYSADISDRYGRNSRIEIYISPRRVPSPHPEGALLMVHGGEEPPSPEVLKKLTARGSDAEPLLVAMQRVKDCSDVVRFDAYSSDPFQTIYLPKNMAKEHRRIWAHVVFVDR